MAEHKKVKFFNTDTFKSWEVREEGDDEKSFNRWTNKVCCLMSRRKPHYLINSRMLSLFQNISVTTRPGLSLVTGVYAFHLYFVNISDNQQDRCRFQYYRVVSGI
jgi:hypothetical protein